MKKSATWFILVRQPNGEWTTDGKEYARKKEAGKDAAFCRIIGGFTVRLFPADEWRALHPDDERLIPEAVG